MKRYVIDTSVAVKWLSDEDDTDKALQLRKDLLDAECQLIIPDLLIYEISNALRHNPHLSDDDVKLALASLFNMSLVMKTPDPACMDRAIDLAFEFDVSVYDAYFLALARIEKIPFITADYTFLKRMKGYSNIVSLSDY